MKIKCLSLTQPYATLMSLGAKRIETRSWSTDYRGPLAIHAAKGFPGRAKTLLCEEPFKRVLGQAGYIRPSDLPTAAIVAVCELKTIARIDYYEPHPDDYAAHDWEGPFLNFGSRSEPLPDEPELSFGDYTPGRYAWVLESVRALPEPIPARGRLGLWEWNGAL